MIKSQKRALHILFFGGDQFSRIHLDALYTELKRNSGIVTSLTVQTSPQSTKDAKKGFSLQQYVQKSLDIPVLPPLTVGKSPRALFDVQSTTADGYAFDLAVVVSFGKFVPDHVIRQFKFGGINVHPSMLPKYRGASPIQYTILNKDQEAGVSIIDLSPDEFDGGKILHQRAVNLKEEGMYRAHFDQMRDFLAQKGAQDLIKVVQNLRHYKQHANSQTGIVSKAPKFTVEDEQVSWNDMDAETIYTRKRALGKPLHCYFALNEHAEKKLVKLHSILDPQAVAIPASLSLQTNAIPGTFYFDPYFSKDVLFICTANKEWLACDMIQVEGKKAVNALEFMNGYQLTNGNKYFY